MNGKTRSEMLTLMIFGWLQIWRVIDLLYRPETEVLAELDQFKSHIANCPPSWESDLSRIIY